MSAVRLVSARERWVVDWRDGDYCDLTVVLVGLGEGGLSWIVFLYEYFLIEGFALNTYNWTVQYTLKSKYLWLHLNLLVRCQNTQKGRMACKISLRFVFLSPRHCSMEISRGNSVSSIASLHGRWRLPGAFYTAVVCPMNSALGTGMERHRALEFGDGETLST